MDWFNIGFTLFMILFPAVFMSLISFNRKAATDRRRTLQLTAWLWAATALAICFWVGLHTLVSARAGRHAIWLFFPLWFGFWGPLMRAKNPDWAATPPPDLPRRSASLAARSREPAAPAWAVWSIWALWACMFVMVVLLVDWTILASVDPDLRSRRVMGRAVLAAAGSMACVPAVTTFALRMVRMEPEPLDPAGSAELAALYAQRRRQRGWFLIGGTWAMLLLFAGLFGAMALISRGLWREAEAGAVVGWVGGIGGSALGIAGGIFGIMSSVQQARINGKLRALSETAV